MEKLKFWFLNARPMSLPQSMMPALTAAFLATKYSDFKWYLALLGIIGVAFAHLSLNLFDDYFDYHNAQQGDRSALDREGFRARTIKCPALLDGSVKPKKWLMVSCLFGAIACAFGVPVLLLRGMRILYVVSGVAVLGIFYSAPPLKLGYHGLGELIIGMIFGPALGIGMCICAAGEFHAGDVFISAAWGLLVVNILYVHSVMDYAADRKAGKKTLAWLVRTETMRYVALALINFVPFVMIIIGVIIKIISPYYLVVLLALPWTVELFSSMLAFKKDPHGSVEKKRWYGNFMLWDDIVANKLEWFMVRWYLAQKISTAFSILCILASIVLMIIRFASL